MYYGIPVRVRFYPANAGVAAQVWAYLESVDAVFNDYSATSEIGTINAMVAHAEVPLSADLSEAFAKSQQLYEWTNGAFDITIAPLRDVWKQWALRDEAPDPKELADVMQRCGMGKVNVRDRRLSAAVPGMKYDFGGVCKGMAVDRVIALLRENGISSALIQIGGDTATMGPSPREQPHRIGIQHPLDTSAVWKTVVDPGGGMSLSTSGNYRNPIVIQGVSYYHIIDMRTGWPADARVLSATVVFPEAGKTWLTDGLSTAGVVLGPDQAIPIIERLGGQALFIMDGGAGRPYERKSNGWDRLLVGEKP